MKTSQQTIELQPLKISDRWTVGKHEFYAIDPDGNVEGDNTFWMFSEDLLQIEMDDYVLDLGWYGDEDGAYCLYLIRGNFLTGELLEKFKTRDRQKVVARLNDITKAVETGQLDNVRGYQVSEDGEKTVDDFENYSSWKK